ncbi:MAG: putative toxin-antitoxin system toxin component, PIN family [Candidatus Berkiellales bacterium]
MDKLIVVYDSCVLYSAPLRDLLMHLAMTDLFRAKWSEDIHEEWTRNVLKNRTDLTKEQLKRTRDLMDSYVRDCLVKGYETLIEKITLPDQNDRHVLAAAIHSSASVIVTYNLKDFPSNETLKYGIEAQHPDEFISKFLEYASGIIRGAIKRLRSTLKNPPIVAEKYLEILAGQSLPKTVSKLREFISLI